MYTLFSFLTMPSDTLHPLSERPMHKPEYLVCR